MGQQRRDQIADLKRQTSELERQEREEEVSDRRQVRARRQRDLDDLPERLHAAFLSDKGRVNDQRVVVDLDALTAELRR